MTLLDQMEAGVSEDSEDEEDGSTGVGCKRERLSYPFVLQKNLIGTAWRALFDLVEKGKRLTSARLDAELDPQ